MAEAKHINTWLKLGALIGLVVLLAVVVGLRHQIATREHVKVPTPLGAREEIRTTAVERTVPSADGFVGVILARHSVQVAPKMEGPLATVNVRMGAQVERGSVIATLDTALLKKELAVAEAVVLSAKSDQERTRAELAQLEVNLEAARRLKKSETGLEIISTVELKKSESEYQAGVAKLESARASLQEKQARVKQVQETLANAEIRAPFDGVVAVRYADPGAMVSTSKPVARLVSNERFLRFAVPEEDQSRIQRGRTVTAVIESQQNERVSAVVETVAPEVDPVSGTIIVEAELQQSDPSKELLPSGSVARVFLADSH